MQWTRLTRAVAYNIEVLEVTAGNFWRPYRDMPSPSARDAPEPAKFAFKP